MFGSGNTKAATWWWSFKDLMVTGNESGKIYEFYSKIIFFNYKISLKIKLIIKIICNTIIYDNDNKKNKI